MDKEKAGEKILNKKVFNVLSVLMTGMILSGTAAIVSGCGVSHAPDVSAPPRTGEATLSHSAENPQDLVINLPANLGLEALCPPQTDHSVCGNVAVSMKKGPSDDKWIYWKAGTSSMIENPAQAFILSSSWDMRVTRIFPLVGSNGGKTAETQGAPGGKAAFAVVPDDRGPFVPRHVTEVLAFPFVEDQFAGLEFQGAKLPPEYQNPLVNNIGPGLVKDYNMKENHKVTLSYRIFILRANDGASYYALRFSYYSKPDNLMAFEWRKLL